MTGRNPVAAAPAAVPAMMPSASGVLRTRAAPNSSTSRYPFVAVPSPNVMTRGSRRISSTSASVMASSAVIVLMAFSFFRNAISCVDVGRELVEARVRGVDGEGGGVLDALRGALLHGVD